MTMVLSAMQSDDGRGDRAAQGVRRVHEGLGQVRHRLRAGLGHRHRSHRLPGAGSGGERGHPSPTPSATLKWDIDVFFVDAVRPTRSCECLVRVDIVSSSVSVPFPVLLLLFQLMWTNVVGGRFSGMDCCRSSALFAILAVFSVVLVCVFFCDRRHHRCVALRIDGRQVGVGDHSASPRFAAGDEFCRANSRAVFFQGRSIQTASESDRSAVVVKRNSRTLVVTLPPLLSTSYARGVHVLKGARGAPQVARRQRVGRCRREGQSLAHSSTLVTRFGRRAMRQCG